VSQKWRNWYQHEVDKEIKGVDSRDKVNHNERSDQLFFTEDMSIAVARSSSDGNAMSYICTSGFVDDDMFNMIERIGQNHRRRVCFVQFARWRHQSKVRQRCLVEFARVATPGAKSTISGYILFYNCCS